MRRIAALLTVLLAAAVLGACSGADDSEREAADVEAAEAPEEEAGAPEDDAASDEDGAAGQVSARVDPAPRHVIYEVDLVIETDDVGGASQRAAAMTEAVGGFVAAESTHGTESATLTLRVPSDGHTAIVSRLEELGEVHDRGRSARDVTSEVVDVEARVASQRRSIERIRALLDEATDLSDVVRIESELASRESDLDSLLQRQEQLASLTSLATITVTFQGSGTAADEDDPELSFVAGLSAGWDAFVGAATVVATVAGAILPFAAAGAMVGVPVWLLVRRHRRSRVSGPPTDTPEGAPSLP